MAFYDWRNPAPQANLTGLDPNLATSEYIHGGYNPGNPFIGDKGYQYQSDMNTTKYNAPVGGTFTSRNGGGWMDANNHTINDLPGYLKMRQLQQSGSDFGTSQNRLQQLLTDPNSIQKTPGFQFALDQGNQAINRSAAAKGMLGSGNVLAELAKYGQGMASQQYDTQINRLSDLIRNSQNFGIQSGYFENPKNVAPGGVTSYAPSTW